MITLLALCSIAFFAGFVDSIAGGGGLIQLPALIFLLPNFPIVTLIGTNKFVNSCGTVVSSFHYSRKLKFPVTHYLPILISAFIFSLLGAKTLTYIHDDVLKPIVFILLCIMLLYTLFKKDFGLVRKHNLVPHHEKLALILIGSVLGFYDGFFGPGMGSLLLFCFISIIGFDFLYATALAKLTNLAANVGAVFFFIYAHKILYHYAFPMMAFNMVGNYAGASFAIKKGSKFIRWIFLAVLVGVLIQFALHISKIF